MRCAPARLRVRCVVLERQLESVPKYPAVLGGGLEGDGAEQT